MPAVADAGQAWCLVIDQGGHSTRALVFDTRGHLQASAALPIKTLTGAAGFIEQDPAEILASVTAVLEQIAARLGDQCSVIKKAGLIVQRSSLLAWDRHSGAAISPVLSWQDTRHAAWLQQHIAGSENRLQQLTGLRANAHYGASKIRWLLDNDPCVQQYSRDALCIGPLSAFLQQRLTQSPVPCVDAVIASRTLLTETGKALWSDTLLDFFAIPRELLPAVRYTTDNYCDITVGDKRIPLRLQGGDQSFIAFAQGKAFFDDSIFINAGTGAFVHRAMCSEQVPAGLLSTPLLVNHACAEHAAIANVMVAEGTVNAAATALDWLWERRRKKLSEMELESALQQPDAVPFFINTVTATGSPDWLPASSPVFSFAADLASEAVAVIESVVFALQRNISLLQAARPAIRIVLSGGLSRLQGFCQRLADISMLPVVCSDDSEASARGAAYCLQDAPAEWQGLPSRTFYPQKHHGLHARYLDWSRAMSALVASSGK
ncbi:MAG TPA: FGGY family carbohydrate kinase [Pseudomonadales bacterium]|nr:FGGY family carbohydrate kinase [Pseudomonadales bacterium]